MPRALFDQDIKPLSEFRANAAFIRQVQTTKRPLVITTHGKSAAVLLDVAEYEALMEKGAGMKRRKGKQRNGFAVKVQQHDQQCRVCRIGKKEGDERMNQNKVAQRLLSQSVSQSVSFFPSFVFKLKAWD